MGEIVIHGINDLKHANGALDAVTVSVFAWAEDVVLSIPTSVEQDNLLPQSGDEYGDGPVSRPMGILARAAGTLSSAPIIGAYAKAAQIGATATSAMAQLFGYARPIDLTVPRKFIPNFFGNIANAMSEDSAIKLTLDPKQELTVDSRTMGLGGDDEMTLKSIAMRESYYVQFPWTVASSPEDLLFTSKVTPIVWDEIVIDDNTEYHLPACAFAALPFNKWRGTMKFRFQIVASAYHKGRLKVVYEPFAPLSNEYNTNFTHIVDLAKQRDFSVDIGWGQPTPFCNTSPTVSVDLPYSTSTPITVPSVLNRDFNGYISVYVVNELTTPNSDINNDISINVYVAMCDDFEVVEPTPDNIALYSVFPEPLVPQSAQLEMQSGDEMNQVDHPMKHPDGDMNEDEDKPMDIPVQHTIAPKLSDSDKTLDVFFADPVTSFRQVLKRYNYHTTYVPVSNGPQYFSVRLMDFPYYRGYDPDGFYSTLTNESYTYARTTLLNYLTPAFGARRGGLRWKAMMNHTSAQLAQGTVSRIPSGRYSGFNIQSTPLFYTGDTTIGERTQQYIDNVDSSLTGSHATFSRYNPNLEYELPFYDFARFHPAKRITSFPQTKLMGAHTLSCIGNYGATDLAGMAMYCSTGEDFTLSFFLGAPVFYAYFDPPAADT
jgi:hypothetical protein